MRHKKRNKIIILSLTLILCFMAVGYSAFSTKLNIKGTSNITSTWDIRITNVVETGTTGYAESAKAPTFNNLTANIEANLYQQGDSIEYSVTIKNNGTIDAVLENITNNTANENSAVRVIFSDYDKNQKLYKNTTQTIKVRVEYNPLFEGTPTEGNTTVTLVLNYVQASVAGIDTPILITPSDLKGLVVTSGSGLYVDEYEAGKYIYRGLTPNNYILFNNEVWRILSINSDNTLKIIKDSSIGQMAWDEATSDTSGPRYNENNTYCYHLRPGQNKYNGCNAWAKVNGEFIHEIEDTAFLENGTFTKGTVTEDSSINKYLNNEYYNNLSSEAKKHIVKGNFYFGTPKENASIAEDISLEKQYIWNGSVGLITASEYLRLSWDEQCNTIHNSYTYNTCMDNYIYKSIKEHGETFVWTISGARNMWHVYLICNNADFQGALPANPALRDGDVRPVVYLNSNIKLTGNGTSTNPYQLAAES